jgi:hypothetical protein
MASQLSPEIKAVMDAVIQAHEAEINSTKKGKGFADVSVVINSGQKVLEEENVRAHFWFKGQSSRTDTYLMDSKSPDKELQKSMATDGEFFYKYNRLVDGASVEHADSAGSVSKIGEDFNFNVFFNWMGRPLSETFKYMKDNCSSKLDIQFDENGFLKLAGDYNEKVKYGAQEMNMKEVFYFLLDPKHAYRIQKYYYEQENVGEPGSSFIEEMQVDWDDYDDKEMYPKTIIFDRFSIRSRKQMKDPEPGETIYDPEIEKHLRINVKEFKSDVHIDNDIFTLEGMGIKHGTKIYDQIRGVLYRYGNNKVTEATLESLLYTPNSVCGVRRFTSDKRQGEKIEAEAPHQSQIQQNEEAASMTGGRVNVEKHSPNILNTSIIVGTIAVAITLLFLLFARIRKTRMEVNRGRNGK